MSKTPTTNEAPTAKRRIIDELAQYICEAGRHDKIPLDSSEERLKAVFLDPREDGSMQLARFGWDIFKDKFPYYAVELKKAMTFGDHTFLIDTSVYPYYLQKIEPEDKRKKPTYRLITFDSDLGVLMKLVSGDFAKMKRLRRKA